nr:hypothetical protein Itr_chr09CG09270 [Ipomoea trifida]
MIHAFSKSFLLFFQRLHVLLEIVDSVLLAQRTHAQEKNSGHREELNEAVLSLHCVGEKAERLLSASYAVGEGGARRRCSGGHGVRIGGQSGQKIESESRREAETGK